MLHPHPSWPHSLLDKRSTSLRWWIIDERATVIHPISPTALSRVLPLTLQFAPFSSSSITPNLKSYSSNCSPPWRRSHPSTTTARGVPKNRQDATQCLQHRPLSSLPSTCAPSVLVPQLRHPLSCSIGKTHWLSSLCSICPIVLLSYISWLVKMVCK